MYKNNIVKGYFMIFGFKLKYDHLAELERRLKMLEKSKVKVGMFSTEQHGDSTWTNVNLFRYLSLGDARKNLPSRNVTLLAMTFNPISTSPMKKELKKYFSNIKKKKTQKDVDQILHSVGMFYRDKVVGLFGASPPLAKNSEWTEQWKKSRGYSTGTPLIATSELRSKVAYKIGAVEYRYK